MLIEIQYVFRIEPLADEDAEDHEQQRAILYLVQPLRSQRRRKSHRTKPNRQLAFTYFEAQRFGNRSKVPSKIGLIPLFKGIRNRNALVRRKARRRTIQKIHLDLISILGFYPSPFFT